MVNTEPAIGYRQKPEAIAVKLVILPTGQETGTEGLLQFLGGGGAEALPAPRSVDGEAQGAVHLLADEP